MNENNILEIKDLSVIYKTDLETVKAVNGINIAIKKKSTFGLVGETGAGKTTTARSIIRLLPSVGHVTSGTIEFEDRNLLELPEAEMRLFRGDKIAMVFQDPMTSLNPVMSVADQIAETIKIHNPELDKAEVGRRVEATLAMVGILPSRKVEYPHQFSGGMKQRVIIAMALACEPQLLIADEPTTALDVTIQAQLLDLLGRIKEQNGMSVILVTHDLGVVASFAQRVQVMYAGQIVERGTVEDIFKRPKHPYTWALLSSIPGRALSSKSELYALKGTPPDLRRPLIGCPFAERCEYCMGICKKQCPSETEVSEGHSASCWLCHELAPKVQPPRIFGGNE